MEVTAQSNPPNDFPGLRITVDVGDNVMTLDTNKVISAAPSGTIIGQLLGTASEFALSVISGAFTINSKNQLVTSALTADLAGVHKTVRIQALRSSPFMEIQQDFDIEVIAGDLVFVPPANVSPPSISGIETQGQTLTVIPGVWTALPGVTYAYQWKRAGVDISGATNSTYVLAGADVGQAITVTEEAIDVGGTAFATSGAITPNAVLDISGTPTATTVQGAAYAGFIPTVSGGHTPRTFALTGTLPAGLSFNTSNGAINGTATTVETRTGLNITVTDADGLTDSLGVFSLAVSAGAPANSVAPAISGIQTQGQTLTVSNGTWSNTPTGYTYVWKRATVPIAGATAQTYVLAALDVGVAITCDVTATNAVGSNTAASASVTPTATLAITGTPSTPALNTAYSFVPTSTGGHTPKTYALTGSLPTGLSFNTSTGEISGTPTVSGTSSGLNITVTDADGLTAPLGTFSLTVAASQKAMLMTGIHSGLTTASQTLYSTFSGTASTNNTTAGLTPKWRGPSSVISGLRLRVNSNSRTTDTVFFVTKNGAATGMTITVPGGGTGVFTEAAPTTVSLTDGDTYGFGHTTGSGSGTLIFVASATNTIAGQAAIQLTQMDLAQAVAQGVTTYATFIGLGGVNTGETNRQFPAAEACTDDQLQVYITANTLSAACVFTYRKNGVDQALTLTVPAGQTGFFEDAVTGHAVTLAADDLTSLKIAAGAGTGSISWRMISVRRTGAVANRISVYSGGSGTTAAATQRFNAIGGVNSSLTSEGEFQLPMPYAAVLSRLTVRNTSNTGTGTTNVRSRVNSANGAQLATVAAGTSGINKDVTNSDTVAAGDLVDINSSAVTGGSMGWNSYGMLVTAQ